MLVATSLLLLNTIPARTPLGLQFLLTPDDPAVLRMEPWQDLPDWALCYWYCLEIERRALVYKERLERLGGRLLETRIDTLMTDPGLRELLSFLDRDSATLWADQALLDRRNDVINDKAAYKSVERSKTIDPALIAEMTQEVDDRVNRCK
jgi:hypothetical protein